MAHLSARRRIAGLLCSLVFAAWAQAQPTARPDNLPRPFSSRDLPVRFHHLSVEHGLSQSSIYDIAQDSLGYIWIATQDGLSRYDGYDVEVFRNEPFNRSSLSDDWITCITPDPTGRLWVGTLRNGLNALDPLTGRSQRYFSDPEDSLAQGINLVRAIARDSSGTIWVGTAVSGLFRLDDAANGKFTQFAHDPDDGRSISHNAVNDILEDSNGRLWVSTNGGLDEYKPEDGGFERHLPPELESRPRLFGLSEDTQNPGVLWIGSTVGLVRFDTWTSEMRRYPIRGSDVAGDAVNNAVNDPVQPDILWVSSNAVGLARLDTRNGTVIHYRNDDTDPNSISADVVTRVFRDRTGMIWAGTSLRGVDTFNPSAVGVALYAHDPQNENSLGGEGVWSGILEDRDGYLWVGTQSIEREYHLNRIDRRTGEVLRLRYDPSNPRGLLDGSVYALHDDSRGQLWVGVNVVGAGVRRAQSGGLSLLDRRTGTFTHFVHDPNDESSISDNDVNVLFEDRDGDLWIGAGALNRMDLESRSIERIVRTSDNPSGVAPGRVQALTQDSAGFIWVGTNRGLNRLDPKTLIATHYDHSPDDSLSLSNRYITGVHERSVEPGVLWIGTMKGLNRLDVETGHVRHFTERDGLCNELVYGILEDDLGRLWLSTNRGLSRFDPDTETFRTYGLEYGLQSLEFNQYAYYKSRNGELFFGGIAGLNAFFPNELTDSSIPPQVSLVDFKLFNRSVKPSRNGPLKRHISKETRIQLRYWQKDVSLDYVGMHYGNPSENHYAYKLEGYDEDWVDAGSERTATYTNLQPGEYAFHVKAANSDGVWSDESTSLRLIISPPFWARWWFRVLAIAVLIGVVYSIIRTRIGAVERRNRLLERKVAHRTKQLAGKNEQLEKSQTIVRLINSSTDLRQLLQTILDECRVIPGVEKATALVFDESDETFHFRATSGWNLEDFRGICLTREEAHERYVQYSTEVAKDIFVAKDVANLPGPERLAGTCLTASFLVHRIWIDNVVAGYLVFDSVTNRDAFDGREFELLEGLRENIRSAFLKTRLLEELAETNEEISAHQQELQQALDHLKATQAQLVHSEKMASLGQLTAGIAHEIKNPLNFVNNFAELTGELVDELYEEITDSAENLSEDVAAELRGLADELKTNAEKIRTHGQRADAIVQGMLQHSRGAAGVSESTDLNNLLEGYLNLSYHGMRARYSDFNVTIEREYDSDLKPVEVVPQEIGRVIINLLNNAFDALRERSDDGESPLIAVSTAVKNGGAEIRISDNGPGIPEALRERIFEPFFTTKPTGVGTGLGLSLSYEIVTQAHGGRLAVENREGGGTTFVIWLPVSRLSTT